MWMHSYVFKTKIIFFNLLHKYLWKFAENVHGAWLVRSSCCCFNFQSQLKFVNFTYNFKVGKCDATHSEKRWAQWKKKIAIKIFARLCHDDDDDDGVSWWRQIWRWVDMPTPPPPPICSPLLPPCATCVEELKLHSEIEPRSVRLIALQSVASIECAFHRPVRIRDRRIHIGTVELRVLLINIVIYLSYISSQLWTLCRGRPCSHLKFYRSEITDNWHLQPRMASRVLHADCKGRLPIASRSIDSCSSIRIGRGRHAKLRLSQCQMRSACEYGNYQRAEQSCPSSPSSPVACWSCPDASTPTRRPPPPHQFSACGDLLNFYLILNTYIKRNQFYCARFACLSNWIQFDLLFDLRSSSRRRRRKEYT